MQKQKHYYPVRFAAEIIRAGEDAFAKLLPTEPKDDHRSWSISIGEETWVFESAEEFYAEYRRTPHAVFVSRTAGPYTFRFQIVRSVDASVTVEAPTRREIESAFVPFDNAERTSRVADGGEDEVRIFIGHGRSPAWRDLKDHLQDQHGYGIEAYETGARAGHTIRDILEDMLEESSFAILVLTADDEMADGGRRARQNVIHEVGLFQGRLGFARAIVLLEEGAEEFSNIAGVQQIRFGAGRIRETFGDVLATLRREFGPRVA